jgi:ABC-type multidrug transport system fused ATPase/permease subunit
VILRNPLIIWKKRLNDYGLSNSVIFLLFVISAISIVTEIISIGMFLPLFELINQNGANGLENSNSEIVEYIQYIMVSIGLSLTIESLLILSFLLFLISKILLYITTYVQSYYHGRILKSMKDKLLNLYLQANSSYYDTVPIGDFSNSSSVELPAAVGGVMLPIKLTITIMSGIGSIVLLLFMSPELTFISICIVGIGALLPLRWVKATTNAGKKNSHYRSIVTSFLLDRLQSPRLVRLSNTVYLEEKEYSIRTEKHRKLTLIIQVLKARISLVLEPMVIGISLLMFYVALKILEMPVGAILLYMIVMVRIVPIITNVLTQKQSLNRSIGPMQAVDRLLNSMMSTSINDCNKIFSDKIDAVEVLRLERVYLCYKNCINDALTNISYTFKEPTLTAIVGSSGGGKTTFVDIISGYRRPTSGSVFINEINTSEYNSEILMSLVSYVPQSPQIFDGITVYEHISYGTPNATKDEIINASKLSGAYDFIQKMSKGFDTILIGSSSGLSGGQKQRLDLSRALLRDAPILIMDEPTGNLDLVSEKELMLNIKNIRKETGKIIIIIAHRIYTIMDADQIIVLEDGGISGFGTHSELILSNSWYKKAVAELNN